MRVKSNVLVVWYSESIFILNQSTFCVLVLKCCRHHRICYFSVRLQVLHKTVIDMGAHRTTRQKTWDRDKHSNNMGQKLSKRNKTYTAVILNKITNKTDNHILVLVLTQNSITPADNYWTLNNNKYRKLMYI